MTCRPLLHILLGPTASGKERTALACAKTLGGEIVSVDSMKIYRGLDIGTAKPSPEMRATVPHHCLDLADPSELFSVARYVEAAEKAIDAITATDKPVILSGGTALYYKGLLEGLFEGPGADPALREELKQRAREEGAAALHAELVQRDPVTAGKVHPNDIRRVVRALEVVLLTGTPISEHQAQWASNDEKQPDMQDIFPNCIVGLAWPRDVLHQRIAQRVDRMMEAGLLNEARRVYDMRETLSRTPLQAVGYKEFFDYFDGKATLEEAVDLLKRNTRHLAKSQMTWFRKFPCTWIEMDEELSVDEVAQAVMNAWTR